MKKQMEDIVAGRRKSRSRQRGGWWQGSEMGSAGQAVERGQLWRDQK